MTGRGEPTTLVPMLAQYDTYKESEARAVRGYRYNGVENRRCGTPVGLHTAPREGEGRGVGCRNRPLPLLAGQHRPYN